MLTKQTSLKEVISLNTLPDIKNREYNTTKTPDLSAISAEQEAFAKTVHRKKTGIISNHCFFDCAITARIVTKNLLLAR